MTKLTARAQDLRDDLIVHGEAILDHPVIKARMAKMPAEQILEAARQAAVRRGEAPTLAEAPDPAGWTSFASW